MMEEMSAADVEVNHSWGLEVPSFTPSDIWWMPQSFAVEMNRALTSAGRDAVRLISPGSELLPSFSTEILGRSVQLLTVQEALSEPTSGWWKSAEAKVDGFASEYRTADELVASISANQLPRDSALHFSEGRLSIDREFRSFLVDGHVVTSSIYLNHLADGSTLTAYDGAISHEGDFDRVSRFLTEISQEIELPISVVADTAILTTGEIVLLEFNPSWCSAWYNCDINGVVDCIEAGFRFDGQQDWTYKPDSYLTQKAAKKAVLPMR
jgi:hypothetical protein